MKKLLNKVLEIEEALHGECQRLKAELAAAQAKRDQTIELRIMIDNEIAKENLGPAITPPACNPIKDEPAKKVCLAEAIAVVLKFNGPLLPHEVREAIEKANITDSSIRSVGSKLCAMKNGGKLKKDKDGKYSLK